MNLLTEKDETLIRKSSNISVDELNCDALVLKQEIKSEQNAHCINENCPKKSNNKNAAQTFLIPKFLQQC